jgi:UDP-galactopyranose mutase
MFVRSATLVLILCCISIHFMLSWIHQIPINSRLIRKQSTSARTSQSTLGLHPNAKKMDAGGLSNVQDGFDGLLGTSFDVCVVGAGLSGAVLAERYASVLKKTVLVIDKREHIAGNCYDFVEPQTGILMNLYGAHLFHTDSDRVFKYVTREDWQDKAPWVRWDHEVKGVLNGKMLPIPVNINTVNSLFNLNIKSTVEMDAWLENVQEPCNTTASSMMDQCADAEAMAISRVGRELYDLIFKPYTLKQWGKLPSALDASVTARIPVRNNHDPRYFTDRYQLLPSKGYTKWFAAVLDHPGIRVALRTDFFKHRHDLLQSCNKTFFTGPIDQYFRKEDLGKLEYRSIHFERQIIHNIGNGYYQAASVVNYPGYEFNFTRIVEYKHFLNQRSPHTVIVREFSTDEGDPYYPVPNQRNRDLYSRYKDLARNEEQQNGVYFVGRLANYKYFNMDQAIMNALEVFQNVEGSPVQMDMEECWDPGLPKGDVSIVFGSNSGSQASAVKISLWLLRIPVSNASLHLFFRSKLAHRLHNYSLFGNKMLPCGLQLSEKILTPNRGNEAAVYLAYIVEHYHDLPEIVVFLHDHGPRSWHSESDIFFKRLRAFYGGVRYEKYNKMAEVGVENKAQLFRRFSSKVRSLSSCYHEGPDTRSPLCIQHLPKRHLLDDPLLWRKTYDTFEGILKEYGASRAEDAGRFWSCCATFMARRRHVLQQPREFYLKSLEAILHLDVPSSISGRWWEYNWYRVLGMQDQSVEDLQDYVRVDESRWPKEHLNRLLTGRPFSNGFQ